MKMPMISLLLFTTMHLALADEGYLPNGSMTDGQDVPTGWRTATGEEGTGTAMAIRDTQVFKTGPASLRLSVKGGTRGAVTCPLPVVAGKKVAVSGWVRAEGKLTSAVLVFVCPGTDQPWQPVKQFSSDGTWRRVNARLNLPSGSEPAENFGHDSWAHTWFLQKMVPPSRTWPAHESYWDIYTVPSSNEFTIHQTIIPTAFYWGFLAAREKFE